MNPCTHKKAFIGLDGAYCPDCKAILSPFSPEYQQILLPQLKIGDRVAVATWGWQHATVKRLNPLTVQFEGRNRTSKLTPADIQQGLYKVEKS